MGVYIWLERNWTLLKGQNTPRKWTNLTSLFSLYQQQRVEIDWKPCINHESKVIWKVLSFQQKIIWKWIKFSGKNNREAFRRARESKLLPPFTRAYEKNIFWKFCGIPHVLPSIEKPYQQPEQFHSNSSLFPLAVPRWSYCDNSENWK